MLTDSKHSKLDVKGISHERPCVQAVLLQLKRGDASQQNDFRNQQPDLFSSEDTETFLKHTALYNNSENLIVFLTLFAYNVAKNITNFVRLMLEINNFKTKQLTV